MAGVLTFYSDSRQWAWEKIFDREAQLHVEIGAGKGDFLMEAASRFPHIDYVGIEKVPTILYAAARKNQEHPVPNLRFLLMDASEMVAVFPPGSIDRIYLNFSDPWPKNKHGSRRLTASSKLALYKELLKPGGQVHLKTDQERFFDFSLAAFVQEGWSVGKICRDLYSSGMEGNIASEYEQRFASLGHPIYRMEAWRKQ